MAGVVATLTNAATGDAITIRREGDGRIPVQNVARGPALDVPGASGDRVEPLGRKSKIVTIERGVLYAQGDRASELSMHTLLQGWHDAGTVLTYRSDLYPTGFNVIIRSYTPVDGETPTGIRYGLVLIESDIQNPLAPVVGVGFDVFGGNCQAAAGAGTPTNEFTIDAYNTAAGSTTTATPTFTVT